MRVDWRIVVGEGVVEPHPTPHYFDRPCILFSAPLPMDLTYPLAQSWVCNQITIPRLHPGLEGDTYIPYILPTFLNIPDLIRSLHYVLPR